MTITTVQALFNFITDHLLTQNAQSLDGHSGRACAYRGRDGRKCAVGCVIPDDRYTPVIEGRGFGRACVLDALRPDVRRLCDSTPAAREVLADVQTIHDQNEPSLWPRQLALAAIRLRLRHSALLTSRLGEIADADAGQHATLTS